MRRFHCIDEKVFEVENYVELAKELWLSQFETPATIEDWMVGFAHRAKMWNGAVLRTDTPAHLIEDALATGIVTELFDGAMPPKVD